MPVGVGATLRELTAAASDLTNDVTGARRFARQILGVPKSLKAFGKVREPPKSGGPLARSPAVMLTHGFMTITCA